MKMRTKVLVFAAVALGLVFIMGLEVHLLASRGQRARAWVIGLQQRFDAYHRLHDSAWGYLHALLHARQEGRDTGGVLRAYQERAEKELARLSASLEQEPQPHAEQRARIEALSQAGLRWARRAEEAARTAAADSPTARAEWWQLLHDFEHEVGVTLEAMEQADRRAMEVGMVNWERNVRLAQTGTAALAVAAAVLVLALGLFTVVPLNRSLRTLMKGVERLGQGDFEHPLPERGSDELGTLARAFNRMAGELRDSLREKQRLMRVEAEIAEREFLRYKTLLEQTVSERTAALEASLRALKTTQAQLHFADRLASVGQLAAGVGHEINNPLAYVLSNVRFAHGELSRWREVPTEAARQDLLAALSEAEEGAERVSVIARDLKALARQDDAQDGTVVLGEVVRSASRMANHVIRLRARLALACDGVPEVRGNGARLTQVFLNLLINAAQAIEPGRVGENEIGVAARVGPPGRVTVEVRDTGCGIAAENLGRVFEPFYTTKRPGEGTGLGLSICQELSAAMGGRIQVESVVGRGTTFRLELLTAEAEALPPELTGERAAGPERWRSVG